MKLIGDKLNMCISDIMVISGIRPAGRTTDHRNDGRLRHGLLYIWDGEVCFEQNGKSDVVAGNGDLLYIPKGHRYKMQFAKSNTTFVIINFEMFTKNEGDVVLLPDIAILGNDENDHRFAAVMAKLEIISSSLNPVSELRKKELVFRLLSIIYTDSLPMLSAKQKYPQILPGVLMLKQSYLENIPVTEFAKLCHISISSFRSLFRKQYGMSPINYRNRLRIDRAKTLLSEGSCTVAEAAYASGFDNIGYFCRSFKKITGKTPGEFNMDKS